MTHQASTTKYTVFVVDDDPAQLDSIRELLNAYGIDCETFASAEAFLAAARLDSPGCLVVDAMMPRMSGLELHEHLTERDAGLGVVVITGRGDVPSCVLSMKRGAANYLQKPFRPDEFISSVGEAIEASQRQWRQTEATREAKELLAKLNDREWTLLKAVVLGRTNREIAGRLDISVRAVQLRKSAILRKVEMQSFDTLVALLHEARDAGGLVAGSG
jgi:FixJ family two-component response regulator